MMTRIVMMKMMSSTNITSTGGVTLMSDIASASSEPATDNDVAIATYLSELRDRRGGLSGGAVPSSMPRPIFAPAIR